MQKCIRHDIIILTIARIFFVKQRMKNDLKSEKFNE